MNHRCWECNKEMPKEQKTKKLLCDDCEEEIRRRYIYGKENTEAKDN